MLYQVLMPGVCDIVYQVREQRVGCFTSHTSTCTDSFFLPMRQQHVGLQKQNKPCTKAHSCLDKDVDFTVAFLQSNDSPRLVRRRTEIEIPCQAFREEENHGTP